MDLPNVIIYILLNCVLMLIHSEALVQQCLYEKSSKPIDTRRRVAVSASSIGHCAFQCTSHAECCEYLWNTTSADSQTNCVLLLMWGVNLLVDDITVEAPVGEGIGQWSLYNDGNQRFFETGCPKTHCDGLTVVTNNTRYFFEYKRLTWNEALASCQQRGMELVSIENTISSESVEFNQLKKVLVKFPETFPLDVDIWTSGNDRDEEGNWKWSKGDPNTEFEIKSDWAWESESASKGGTSKNCLALWSSRMYRWHDQQCETKLMSICEDTVEFPTEQPSTTVTLTTSSPATSTTKSSRKLDINQLIKGGKLGGNPVHR